MTSAWQRPRVLLLALTVVLTAGLLLAAPATGGNQAATPGADGVTVEFLGGVRAPGDGGFLEVFRVELGPDVPVEAHVHPGPIVFAVVSGSVIFGATAGTVLQPGIGGDDFADLCKGGCLQLPLIADGVLDAGILPVDAEASTAAGLRVLGPGDVVVQAETASHTYRAGPEGAVILISRLDSADGAEPPPPDECQPDESGRC